MYDIMATIRLHWKRKNSNDPQIPPNGPRSAPTTLVTYDKEITQIFPTANGKKASNTTDIRTILGPLLVKNVEYCKTLVYYKVSWDAHFDSLYCVSVTCKSTILSFYFLLFPSFSFCTMSMGTPPSEETLGILLESTE